MRQMLMSCHVCHKPSGSGTEMSKCSACGQRRYCSQACQAADWKAVHKTQCAADDADSKKKGKKKGGKKR